MPYVTVRKENGEQVDIWYPAGSSPRLPKGAQLLKSPASRARQPQPRPRSSDNEFFKEYVREQTFLPLLKWVPVAAFVLWPLWLWNDHGEVTGWGVLSELVWLALLAWPFFAIRKAMKRSRN